MYLTCASGCEGGFSMAMARVVEKNRRAVRESITGRCNNIMAGHGRVVVVVVVGN
jgi:hypothetical protein